MNALTWLVVVSICTVSLAITWPAHGEDAELEDAFEEADFEAVFEEAVNEGVDQENGDDEATNAIKALIELGGGVQPIHRSEDGEIETMLIVGSSSIPKSLRGAKGKQLASRRARIEAIKHFIRFLSEEAVLFESQGDEFIVATEGSAVDGELSESESSKTISKGTEKFESISKGLVRGMELIGLKIDSENRVLYRAYGWSTENDLAAEKLSQRGRGGGENGLESKEVISIRASIFFRRD